MPNMTLSKILKTGLILALLLLCALLGWALVLFVMGMDIQWWARAMLLTCLAATVVTVFLLWKLWLKRKEMKFVDGIIGTDMPGNVSSADEASRELRKRFKEAVSTLRKSYLRGRGNPLYVLPWYLIVGKSGSGKSTAIKSARLPSPFGDINRISGIEGTRNCDWWFFDDSVVIDIAGRYSIPHNEELDRSEWLTFLKHLVKYRKKEPINGILVTVEADQLLGGDVESIEAEGRILRNRVDEVIHVMGAKFPIFLLVTKCDLVFGMNRFCELIPESAREQAMGRLNHDGETDIHAIVKKTMDSLVDKLKDFRLILSNSEEVRDSHYVEPEALLFPEEMDRLRKGLQIFCQGAFKDNPFQELPPIRGIYFCSGQQSGRPVPARAEGTDKMEAKELPGTGHGFFLHDFFAGILPADRYLYAPTRRAVEWQRLTGNLWLTGFITIMLLLCILLTHSWNENKSAINTLAPKYKQTILFQNEPVADIALMADFGTQIKKIEAVNENWRAPRMGLTASIRLEKELKRRYCQRFYEHFDAAINNRIKGKIADGGWSGNNFKAAVRYIPFIARRINLLKAKFDGADAKHLAELPDPDYALMLFGGDGSSAAEDILRHYKRVYIDYLVWQNEVEPLNKSLAGMQRLLNNYFSENKGDMSWLITWANTHLRGQAVTMNTFWHGDLPDSEMAGIGAAFTRAGQKLIGRFVTEELESAVGQSIYMAQSKQRFVLNYQEAFFAAWMDFCADFDKGPDLFENPADKRAAIESLATGASPYEELFDRLGKELFKVKEAKTWPSLALKARYVEKYGGWLKRIRRFAALRQASAGENLSGTSAGTSAGRKISNSMGPKTAFAAELASDAMSASIMGKANDAYQQYQNALAEFAGITRDRKYAYQLARAGFEDSPARARSALYRAENAIADLKMALAKDENAGRDKEKQAFRQLLARPLQLLWKISVAQAGCHLQALWDQEVLVKTKNIRDLRRKSSLLFGSSGLAEKFMQTRAKAFVRQTASRGYYCTAKQGARIPFYRSFFNYLERGRQWRAVSGGTPKPSYTVSVTAYPTDVNTDARLKPYMTRLVLEDGEAPMVLKNRQYPVDKRFTWIPENDGDVTLEIVFENVTLPVRYTGYCAFGQFLKDFSDGSETFAASDFPGQLTELRRLGVKHIKVNYEMQASQVRPIVKLLGETPGRPPRRIVSCKNPAG